MEKYLIENENYWYIKTNQNTYTIRTGLINQPGTVQTTTLNSEEEVLKETKKLINDKLEEDYYEETLPFINDLTVEIDYIYEINILIDLDDKEKVTEIIDRVFEYQKKCGDYCLYFINYVIENKLDESYEQIDFFHKALELYPELEEKVGEIGKYAIESGTTVRFEDTDLYLFNSELWALVLFNKEKYFDQYFKFLKSLDWDHMESQTAAIDEVHDIVKSLGICDESLRLMASCFSTLGSQHAIYFELDKYFKKEDVEIFDRFFQFLFLEINPQEINEDDDCYTQAWHFNDAKNQVWNIQYALNIFKIKIEEERLMIAFGTANNKNPHKFSKILNPDYEIPINSNQCVGIGNYYFKKEAFDKAMNYYNQAFEKDPNNSHVYKAKGDYYEHFNELEKAEIEWKKSNELRDR